jgi:hypothetical protein
VTSCIFLISPVVFGSIVLKVRGEKEIVAGKEEKRYALAKSLLVIPPGEKQTGSVRTLLSLKEIEGKSSSSKSNSISAVLTAVFPKMRVEGTDSVEFTIASDLLSSTIENLDSLLMEMPMGCGESNMLNFLADHLIVEYLNSASFSIQPNIKSKVV